jgi:hypothetical protein
MSEETSGGWRQIGKHLLRVDPPDLVLVRAQGDLLPDELREMLDEARRLAAVVGPVLWLSDISALGDMPAETRKVAAMSGVLTFVHASACIGARPIPRALVTLILHAAKLTNARSSMPPFRFVGTEAEGRAWLAEVRRSRDSSRG